MKRGLISMGIANTLSAYFPRIPDKEVLLLEATVTKTIGHFVNGRILPGSGERYGNVYDPAKGEVTARVSFAGKKEVEEAVASAAAAFPAWAATAGFPTC
jgi:delta 1-pyrroline-5-carboxylate dehydrogenase